MTPPDDRIPLVQKLAYALGIFVNNLQSAGLDAMVVILNLGLGMDPRLVGIISFVSRGLDALSDPVVGYISDTTASRWGRRRPYILCGALMSGLIFAAMWQLPTGLSEQFYFWCCLATFSLFYLAFTLFATPLIALGYELTADYHERTQLQAVANMFGQAVWIGAPWIYAFLASDLFDNTVEGVRVLAIIIGGAMCVVGIVPALVCRERRASPSAATPTRKPRLTAHSVWEHTGKFFRELVAVFRCRPYVKLCTATFLVFNGFQLGTTFSLYVLIYYIFSGDNQQAGTLLGAFGTGTACCALGVIALTPWLSRRLGKRTALATTIAISLIGYVLKWFGYDPQRPYLLLFACPFVAFGVGSLFTLVSSMLADVCDYNELARGERREGVFGAVYWWMVKVGMALAGLLGGVLLSASGFDVDLAAQSQATLLQLRLFDVGIPFVTSALAIGVLMTYSIDESTARDIRAQLEERRSMTLP